MTDLVIFGAGGHARETHQLVLDINADTPTWNLLGFLDGGAGSLDGSGRLSVDPESPVLAVNLEGRNLAWGGYSILTAPSIIASSTLSRYSASACWSAAVSISSRIAARSSSTLPRSSPS